MTAIHLIPSYYSITTHLSTGLAAIEYALDEQNGAFGLDWIGSSLATREDGRICQPVSGARQKESLRVLSVSRGSLPLACVQFRWI